MQEIAQATNAKAFVQDPYPFYRKARALGDLVHWKEYGIPVAFSHRAVSVLLRDKRFARTSPDPSPEMPAHLADFYALEAHSLLELDGETHIRLRRRVMGAFSSKEVMLMSPMVSVITDDLIAEFPDGPFDLIEIFAQRLPIAVISRIIGVPSEMAGALLDWSHRMVAMYQPNPSLETENAANTAAAEFAAYLESLIAERRARPQDDLTSKLVAVGSTELGDAELISTLVLLLNAGHEATVHSIGNGMNALLSRDQPRETMLPLHVTDTIDEILRYDPPLHMFMRYAQENVEVFGSKIARGQKLGACLAAANRDPKIWPLPDEFDPTRSDSGQVSFGAGPHFCLGAPLAKLELQVALPALFSPSVGLELVEPAIYDDIYHFRGLRRLMVRRTR